MLNVRNENQNSPVYKHLKCSNFNLSIYYSFEYSSSAYLPHIENLELLKKQI